MVFRTGTAVACLDGSSHPAAICSPMRGTWRAATLKNARQITTEALAQKISRIIIGRAESRLTRSVRLGPTDA